MTDLAAPPPVLTYEGSPSFATLEQPIDVRVGPVMDGPAALGPEVLKTYGYLVYRRAISGAALDIWDDGTKVWTSELDAGAVRQPVPLSYESAEPEPWHGILVAAGARDSAGKPQYEKAAGGYPNYSVRALFSRADASELLLTGPSPTVAFVATADKNLVVVGPGDDEEPDAATQARVLLKSTSLQVIGRLEMQRSGAGAVVTLGNASGASIVLHTDGRIELTPAAGQRVVVNGDLEADLITYLPAGGGAKQTLG